LKVAEEAVKQKLGHVVYLQALLAAEVEERQRHAVATGTMKSRALS